MSLKDRRRRSTSPTHTVGCRNTSSSDDVTDRRPPARTRARLSFPCSNPYHAPPSACRLLTVSSWPWQLCAVCIHRTAPPRLPPHRRCRCCCCCNNQGRLDASSRQRLRGDDGHVYPAVRGTSGGMASLCRGLIEWLTSSAARLPSCHVDESARRNVRSSFSSARENASAPCPPCRPAAHTGTGSACRRRVRSRRRQLPPVEIQDCDVHDGDDSRTAEAL